MRSHYVIIGCLTFVLTIIVITIGLSWSGIDKIDAAVQNGYTSLDTYTIEAPTNENGDFHLSPYELEGLGCNPVDCVWGMTVAFYAEGIGAWYANIASYFRSSAWSKDGINGKKKKDMAVIPKHRLSFL